MHLNKIAFTLAGLMFCSSVAFAQEAAPAAAPAEPAPAAAPAAPAPAAEPAPAPAPAPAAAPAPAPAPKPAANGSYIKDANDIAGATAMLKKVDENHNPFKDQWIHTKMVLNGGVHKNTTYDFDTYTKGTNRRSVRFFEPAEMRGMGVVTKGRDEVYARLPDSQKIRRVGTHAKRQSFYGSDWSMDDMSMIYMADDYDVVKILDLNDNGGSHVKLELKLKANADLPYPKLIIKLDKKLMFMDYIEYYSEAGKLIKTQERDTPKDFGNGHLIYTHVKVTDANTKHTTENFVDAEKTNQNIPDETFTKRWLLKSL